jgi:CheY-like chemotaxis protein
MFDLKDASTWVVLVVDDEPDNLEVVSETLEFHGVTVRTAKDGVDGLEVLKAFEPNLILTDLSMPRMDGWEMRRNVKSDPKMQNIPIIALSAHAITGDKERALEIGFDGYLTKPVNIHTLLDDIRGAVPQTYEGKVS